jgi:hypothetical protein
MLTLYRFAVALELHFWGVPDGGISGNSHQAGLQKLTRQKARSKMRTILLAVFGARPDRKTVSYAEQLSRQMGAKLDVLRMAKTKEGNPPVELIRYLNEHREVVCTICDAAAESRRQWKEFRKKIPRNLPVPLVVVQR